LTTVNLNSFFYDHILEQQGIVVNTRISVFIEQVEKEGIAKVLKRMKVYKTTGRGEIRINGLSVLSDKQYFSKYVQSIWV
jgi:hypothetical protein